MKKKSVTAIAGLLIVAVLAGYLYVIAGAGNVERLMWEHLENRGHLREEIQSVVVSHSFLSPLLSSPRWSIRVRYADEPGVTYLYTVEDGRIQASGVTGGAGKEERKHGE